MVQMQEQDTNNELFAVRRRTPYTEAERQYSVMLRKRLEEILEATCRQVVLMRKVYRPDGSTDISVLPAGAGIDRNALRPDVIEQMLCATLSFVRHGAPGGPVFQSTEDGKLVETQMYATRYPHIIIERVDTYTPSGAAVASEWRMRRTQNQRAETQINRWLDAADLGMSILKSITGAS